MTSASSLLQLLALALILVSASACASDTSFSTAAPDGWESRDSKWWLPGTDTAAAFRDLESLVSMNVKGAEMVYGTGTAARESFQQQLQRAVKQSLIQILRNEPEVVDSLMELVVVPKIKASGSDVDALVKKYKSEGYRSLSRHFREPREKIRVGVDIPVVYPDSLRQSGVVGAVEMQLYLDIEGVPQAIWMMEGVHPVLDALAMQATSQARWQPAYLLRGGKSDPIASWVRFKIRFG
jgi:hypothetical protein